MQVKDVGVIFDIESSNFIADGSLYINGIAEEEQEISLISKTLSSFSFENVAAKIISDATSVHDIKTEEYYSNELSDFFNKNKMKKVDVIFFAETGIRGIDKVSLKDSSIIYFSLYANIKLGFFINKTIANVLFGGNNVTN